MATVHLIDDSYLITRIHKFMAQKSPPFVAFVGVAPRFLNEPIPPRVPTAGKASSTKLELLRGAALESAGSQVEVLHGWRMTGIGKSPHVFNRRDTSTHSSLEFSSQAFVLFSLEGGNVLLSGSLTLRQIILQSVCMIFSTGLFSWWTNKTKESHSCFRSTSSTGSKKKIKPIKTAQKGLAKWVY